MNWFKSLPLTYRISILVVILIGAAFGFWPVPEDLNVIVETPNGKYATGWTQNDEAVKEVSQTLAFPTFADTPAARVAEDSLPQSVYLWQAERAITGQNPPVKNQGQVGSCVSFGTNTAIERTIAVQIAKRNANAKFFRCVEEVTYGGSRYEIGGGKISGDGSVGAWAAQKINIRIAYFIPFLLHQC